MKVSRKCAVLIPSLKFSSDKSLNYIFHKISTRHKNIERLVDDSYSVWSRMPQGGVHEGGGLHEGGVGVIPAVRPSSMALGRLVGCRYVA